eukprot:5473909-Amphidinium_carterae.3
MFLEFNMLVVNGDELKKDRVQNFLERVPTSSPQKSECATTAWIPRCDMRLAGNARLNLSCLTPPFRPMPNSAVVRCAEQKGHTFGCRLLRLTDTLTIDVPSY